MSYSKSPKFTADTPGVWNLLHPGGGGRLNLCMFLLMLAMTVSVKPTLAQEVRYTIITAEGLQPTVERIRFAISRELKGAKPEEADYLSDIGKQWINELAIEQLPCVIFDKNIVESESFFPLARNGMIERKQGHYVIPQQTIRPFAVMYFKRQRLPGQLEVFVKSHSPASIEAVRKLFKTLS
jgi:hypothetical protein